ncbi:MAG: hypothetical protein LUE64_05985 [Candidatus Gastranaerophilales bacterium]|nr:hypothetical protein [Candidatus Gastranaerophilales bacterium]
MKNTNKKAKNKASFRILKSVFKKVIKQNCAVRFNQGCNIVSGIKFEYSDEKLTIVSTNGCELLVNEILVTDGKGKCEAVYNGDILEKITFIKDVLIGGGCVDFLEFEMSPDQLIIKDFANRITYCIPKLPADREYPEYKKLFPNVEKKEKEYTTLGVNIRYLERLKNMSVNSRYNLLKISFKNNSPLSCIVAESKDEDKNVKSKSLIMPIQLMNGE